ncbi:MAG: 3-isopropylmalate dehydratase small subunit [Bosea sp. (in: a-proteobacteria)]
MERFTTLTARACPLGLANVDTDQLIPARFMKRSRADGYGGFLLHDLRVAADGALNPDFVLNQPAHAGAAILVARRNFGTGSSREAAVYALWDYGIRCVIAPSFGDIFASNAVKNGLLPAQVSEADVEALLAIFAQGGILTVDLDALVIASGTLVCRFAVDPVRRLQLLNGWDDIDLTLRHTADIVAYREKRLEANPWAWPSPGATAA